MTKMLVSIRDLTLRLPSGDRTLTVLDGVSLDVAAGETVAVAGPSGSGSMPRTGRPQVEWKTCAARSSVNTSSAESTNRVVPSGCEQAPRPFTAAAARRATSSASMPPEPSTIAASARAIEGRPSLHGPHWPADSPAR